MNRLTIMTPDGAALDMDDTYPSENAAREALMAKFRVAVERLAAYEDTGLMPDEVTDLKQAWDMYGGEEGITAALEELERRKKEPPNDPLTLDELIKMYGEPVYCIKDYQYQIIGDGEKSHQLHAEEWGIVIGTDLGDQGFTVGTAYIYHLEDYGKTWIAYRRKPEENTNVKTV